MSEDLRKDTDMYDENRYKGPHHGHDKDCCKDDKDDYDNLWKDNKDKDKNKDCDKDKDKHCKKDADCCCDTDTLRKILDLFKKRNILVNITSRADSFEGFISTLSENIVDISPTLGGTPNQFIPLCNIVRVIANVSGLPSAIRQELSNMLQSLIHSTRCLSPCCCTDGIADTINSIKKFSNTSNILCFTLDIIDFDIIPDNCFSINNILKANEDIVFAVFENNFYILPTCGIDSMFIGTPADSLINTNLSKIFSKK